MRVSKPGFFRELRKPERFLDARLLVLPFGPSLRDGAAMLCFFSSFILLGVALAASNQILAVEFATLRSFRVLPFCLGGYLSALRPGSYFISWRLRVLLWWDSSSNSGMVCSVSIE
jgi:hypothetical protein